MKVRVKSSPGKGKGVFAEKIIRRGEVIEECEILLLPKKQEKALKQTLLIDYYFMWPDGRPAISLGLGSLYNHSYKPNAMYLMDTITKRISFEALRRISPGEEITVNYNGEPDSTTEIWFKVK